MVPGQPADAAVGRLDFKADAMGMKIIKQGAVGDRDAVREAGRAAGILEIGDLVRICIRQG